MATYLIFIADLYPFCNFFYECRLDLKQLQWTSNLKFHKHVSSQRRHVLLLSVFACTFFLLRSSIGSSGEDLALLHIFMACSERKLHEWKDQVRRDQSFHQFIDKWLVSSTRKRYAAPNPNTSPRHDPHVTDKCIFMTFQVFSSVLTSSLWIGDCLGKRNKETKNSNTDEQSQHISLDPDPVCSFFSSFDFVATAPFQAVGPWLNFQRKSGFLNQHLPHFFQISIRT